MHQMTKMSLAKLLNNLHISVVCNGEWVWGLNLNHWGEFGVTIDFADVCSLIQNVEQLSKV